MRHVCRSITRGRTENVRRKGLMTRNNLLIPDDNPLTLNDNPLIPAGKES